MAPDIGAEFDSWVDQKVAEVMQPHASDFATLVESLPSIYPAEILASLKRLRTSHVQANGTAAALTHSATVASQTLSISSNRTKLPPPHPLDYEWRFSRTAVDVLVGAGNACTEHEAPIALVGTPTIAASPEALFGHRAVTYFGVDTDALRALGPPAWLAALFNVNLLVRPSNAGTYSTVIMDPPWYEEYLQRFLWFAAVVSQRYTKRVV